jgi:hypothetical protein
MVAQLILEANADARWLVANLSAAKNKKAIADGQAFEEAKQKADQIHFLAVQENLTQKILLDFGC